MFFETNDLVIDKLTTDDVVRFHQICNQPFILKWMEDWKHNWEEIQDLVTFFIQGYSVMNPDNYPLALAVRLKETKALIGMCGFGTKDELNGDVEICYFIDENFSNMGYMSQVLKKAINYYFDLTGKSYLCAMVDEKNIPSYRLLQKNKFVFYPIDETSKVQSHYRVHSKNKSV
jgi:Acetyltransferases, including N-acetylases of ribosomal proteins